METLRNIRRNNDFKNGIWILIHGISGLHLASPLKGKDSVVSGGNFEQSQAWQGNGADRGRYTIVESTA